MLNHLVNNATDLLIDGIGDIVNQRTITRSIDNDRVTELDIKALLDFRHAKFSFDLRYRSYPSIDNTIGVDK